MTPQQAGTFVQTMDRYGPQIRYVANGIKVVVATSGANAGKIVTAFISRGCGMRIDEATINEALRLEDIESLFQHGAPNDEYSNEARTIASEINLIGEDGVLSEDRLAEVIRAVWNRSFGPFSNDEIEARMPAFRQVAQRIITRR